MLKPYSRKPRPFGTAATRIVGTPGNAMYPETAFIQLELLAMGDDNPTDRDRAAARFALKAGDTELLIRRLQASLRRLRQRTSE